MLLKKLIISAIIVAACIFILGCSSTVPFTRAVYSNSSEGSGSLSIQVIDSRLEGVGAKEPVRLGTIRGGYGNPMEVNTDSKKTVAEEIKVTVSQALTQSGYSVVEDKAPVLKVIINKFWCDGYTGYQLDADVEIQLLGAEKTAVLYNKKIVESTGFAIIFSRSPMEDAFNEIMNRIGTQTAGISKSAEFKNALATLKP